MRNHKKHNSNPYDVDTDCEISEEVLDVLAELSKTAFRIYKYLNKYAYKRNGVILIDNKELKFELKFKENKSIYNGLSELLNKDIIAADTEKNHYYYNPKFIAYDI